jgi:hypothetical protein
MIVWVTPSSVCGGCYSSLPGSKFLMEELFLPNSSGLLAFMLISVSILPDLYVLTSDDAVINEKFIGEPV